MSGSVKVPGEWFERDDVEAVGAEAAMLHLSALGYSARHLTNGMIANRQLRRLWPTEEAVHKVVTTLVEAGWWEPVDDGWLILDWHTFILDASEVERLRAKNREYVERHRRHKRGDHSMCERCSAVRHGASKGMSKGLTQDLSKGLSKGDPNRTEPKVRGEEDGAGEAVSAGLASLPEIETPAAPPSAEYAAMRRFLGTPKAKQAEAKATARAELGDDADDGAILARAVEIIGGDA